jgi:hypothetical protein
MQASAACAPHCLGAVRAFVMHIEKSNLSRLSNPVKLALQRAFCVFLTKFFSSANVPRNKPRQLYMLLHSEVVRHIL